MEAVVGQFSGSWQFQQFEKITGRNVLEFDVIDRRTLLDLLQIVLPEEMCSFLAGFLIMFLKNQKLNAQV